MKPIGNNSNVDVFDVHKAQMQQRSKIAREKLITDLEEQPPSLSKNRIIKNARNGRYSDFGASIPMPKSQLIADLEVAGFEALVSKAKQGLYDNW